MINKFHIISFITVLLLYLTVAIWKYSPVVQSNGKSDSPATPVNTTDNFWNNFNEANEHRINREYRLASLKYDRALTYNETHKDALYYSGSTYLMQKEFDKALKRWEILYDLEPNAPRTHLQLGTLYFCMDIDNPHFDLEQAYSQISRAWSLNREETGAPILLAKISLLQNQINSAKDLVQDVMATDPSNVEIHFLSAYIQWIYGNNEKARNLLNQAERLQQELDNSILEGEGNTESGARAMLSEDRYCDKFENTVKSLLYSTKMSDSTFLNFTTKLSGWREEFQIN